SLAIDPTNPDIVYVGTGGPNNADSPGAIYKTEDGGEHWKKMNQGADLDYTVVDLAIDPNDPNIIWAVTDSFGSDPQYYWWGTLYRTDNGGESWSGVFSINGSFYDVEVKPNDSNSIFTANGWGIFRHYFEEDEWKYEWILNYWGEWPPPPEEVFARNVRALTFDRQNPEVLYAAWKNPWGGDARPKVARGVPPYGDSNWEIYTVGYQFLALAVHPTNGEVMFGGELNLGVYKSQDHGQTWTPVNNGINAVIVYDVAIDPNDSTHILAAAGSGVHEKKWEEPWSLISDFPYSTAYSVEFHPTNSQVFYAGIEGQLAKTTDGGASWTFSNWLEESGNRYNYVSDIAIYLTNTEPLTIFIAVNGFGNYGEVYKRIDGDGSFKFKKVLDGENLFGEKYPFNTVAIDHSDHQHIFAAGGNFYAPKILGDLWETTDGGVSWTRTDLQNVIVNALLIDPKNA
ncbi:MAG: hypothetical protein KAU38_14665, partial [Desulfobacterales bacterium]|nr:hypothetical protein [Desulfobacterales bacterium]